MPQEVLSNPSLDRARPILEERKQMVRFDWEVPVRRLNEKLAACTLDLRKDLPLNAPVADVFKKRVAVYEAHRTVAKGQVGCIGHDEGRHIRVPAYITVHNVKSDDSIPDAECD